MSDQGINKAVDLAFIAYERGKVEGLREAYRADPHRIVERRMLLPFPEGDVTISFPDPLSVVSAEFLVEYVGVWLQGVARRAHAAAAAKEAATQPSEDASQTGSGTREVQARSAETTEQSTACTPPRGGRGRRCVATSGACPMPRAGRSKTESARSTKRGTPTTGAEPTKSLFGKPAGT